MRVHELMRSAPTSVTTDETLDRVLAVMDSLGIRHVPVLDDDGTLVGVVSDRDLYEATGCLPRRVHAARGPCGAEAVPTRVAEVVRSPAHRTRPDGSARGAVLELRARRIGCLPVVDGGELVGLVTEMDAIEAYLGAPPAGGPSEADDPPVSAWMSAGAVTIDPDRTLADAAELMRAGGFRHVPVVLGDALLGLVSDRDLRRAAGVGRDDDRTVESVMSRDPVTVAPDDPVTAACRRMVARRISALPVVVDGTVVGILTTTDLLDLCAERMREPEADPPPHARSA